MIRIGGDVTTNSVKRLTRSARKFIPDGRATAISLGSPLDLETR